MAANSRQGHSTDPGYHEMLAGCRDAFRSDGYPDLSTRLDRLDRLRALAADKPGETIEALQSDYGHRSATQSLITDSLAVSLQLRHTRRRLKRWMKPRNRWVGMPFAAIGGRARIEWEPLGVVGIISPWNFPIALTLQPLGQALGAGNRVLCKVSESTPATAELIQRRVAERFDPTEVAVITGGPEDSARFSALDFDHLFFTGGGSVGRQVMRAAASNLTPVTLELGGKCPLVVGPDADLDKVAACLMFGKTLNAGQYCVAPDYALVPEDMIDRLGEACAAELSKMYSTVDDDDYTAIIDERNYARLQGLVADAQGQGASVLELLPEGDRAGRQMAPKILLDVTDTMAIAHKEIFGPLLPLIGYRDIDDAITYINNRPKPLAAYHFGSDSADQRRFVQRTASGGISINDIMLHAGLENLPFGGVGASGMGSYHGRAGFETFSHAKPVVRSPRSLTPMLAPPYSSRVGRILTTAARLEFNAARRAIAHRRSRRLGLPRLWLTP